MKVVSLFGSPRNEGNTATVLGWAEAELTGAGHEVERINLAERNVDGCIECYVCQSTPDEPGCPLEDEAMDIFTKMMNADALIYSSPLFCWGWTAQIKPLIDRHFCLCRNPYQENWKSFIGDKKSALLVTAGGPIEDNADLLVKQFEGLAAFFKLDVRNRLVVPMCTGPDEIPAEFQDKAKELARSLMT